MNSRSETPRTGVRGHWDRLVGPGTSKTENTLILGFSFAFTGGVLAYAMYNNLGWNLLQIAVIVLFGIDIAGGVIANSTIPGSQWWHRSGQSDRAHIRFITLHIHPFVVAAVFPELTWVEAVIGYAFLLLAMGIVLRVPRRIKRPVAMGVFAVGLGVSLYVVAPPSGLEWFLPLLYLKLIPGHLVPPN